MFLDDALYARYKEYDKREGTITDFINSLYKICEDSWKKGITDKSHPTITVAAIERAWKSWHIFQSKVIKQDIALGVLLDEYSYEKSFKGSHELYSIYETLKQQK